MMIMVIEMNGFEVNRILNKMMDSTKRINMQLMVSSLIIDKNTKK